MPVNPTYPGVYVEELSSGVRTVTGVSTSIAAFVDFFKKGPMNKAVQLLSLSDFEREFGGLDTRSEASYAIQQFFLNGGQEAWVVRTASGNPLAAHYSILPGTALTVSAISEGEWGNFIRVAIDYNTSDPANLFNVVVSEYAGSGATARVVRSEVFRNLSMDTVATVVNDDGTGSKLVRMAASGTTMPKQNGTTSGVLTDSLNLTADYPGVGVAIGGSGTRAARFATRPTTLQEARPVLQAAIRAASPYDPAFAAASVEIVNGRLRVLSGPAEPKTQVVFSAWSETPDPAVTELGLDSAGALLWKMSGDLTSFTGLTNDPGMVSVTIGGTSTDVAVAGIKEPGHTLAEARAALADGLTAAGFVGTQVVLVGNHLLVLPANPAHAVSFATSGTDPACHELGLDSLVAAPGKISGDLTVAFPGLTNDPAIVWVTIDTTKQDVYLKGIKAGSTSTPEKARKALADGLTAAGFVGTQVVLVGNHLVVLPGDPAVTVMTFAQFTGDTTTVTELKLDTADTAAQQYELAGGADGSLPGANELANPSIPKTGIYALDDVDLFNILCIPRAALLDETERSAVLNAAISYCVQRRAFFVVDPPAGINDVQGIKDWLDAASLPHKDYAALYFPRVKIADPLEGYRLRTFGPSGTIAGLYARTDSARGVWKAPAGTDATLVNVQALDCVLTDAQNGTLNPLAINCLRTFPVYGTICWGARTVAGADQSPSDWKYVPVRRFALFLEESLYRGTKWVVFEPNDEPLWAQIRLNIGAFMHSLFRQGAFQGTNPKDAYFVKCDKETTTQDDINKGIVNILVGFAPLKPAEFVIIQIQQMAGQIQV